MDWLVIAGVAVALALVAAWVFARSGVLVTLANRMRAWFVSAEVAGRDQVNITADTICIQLIGGEVRHLALEAAKLERRLPGEAEDPWSTHETLRHLVWEVEDLKLRIQARAVGAEVEEHLADVVKTETEELP